MNTRILQILSSTRLTAALLFALLSLVIAQSPADEANTLPDLGTPAANTGSVQPNINAQGAGFNYRDNINGKLISINPQYNQQNGVAVGGSLASPLSKIMAVGILLTAGSDKNEWLLNTGFDLTSNQRFIFSLGQLRQKLDFNFISGSQKTSVRQDNIAASYQYFLGKDWLNAAEVNAYLSNTGSITLGDKTYFTDTTSLYELWSDPRRIAGGRVTGVQGRLVFTPTSKTTIKVGLGAERLTYDYLTGNESTTRATGSAELVQRLDNDFNFRASANAASSQNRYALGLGRSFKGGAQLGIDVATIQGRDHTFNDNQLLLSYTQSFGGNNASAFGSNPMGMNNTALNNLDAAGAPMNQASTNTATHNPAANSWASSLVDQVSRRPSFLPSQVIAKIDTTATPTRLIAIDKTAVPVGSSISTATGVITVPTGTPVSGIAGVTKNSIAFTNIGQFALSGTGLLVVNPNLIIQPAVGVTDTYVVTMNNSSGGGTTLATLRLAHGSTKIDSVVISSGQVAQTITFGALSSKLSTDANFSLSATASSALSVSFASNSLSVCTVASSTVTLVAPGTCSITASQAGNGAYIAATDVTQTFAVSAIVPTLSGFSAINKTYGNTAFSITPPTTNSAGAFTYASSNTSVATLSGSTVTIIGTGSSTITATQAANGNYASSTTTTTITVTSATPTLSGFGLSSSSVAFGATAPTITTPTSASSGAITYTSATAGVATITSSGVITIAGVGTSVLTATQAANGNYASSTTTTTITVTAIIINTAAIAGVTAPVTGATPVTSVSGTGYTGTVTWSGSPTTFAAATTYTATVTLTANTGYTLTGVTANFFTVSGATATNSASAGVVGAAFPATVLPSGYITSGGLIWAPITFGNIATWPNAVIACAAMNTNSVLGYSTQWRQPNVSELINLYSSGALSPTPAGWFLYPTWSSTSNGAGSYYEESLDNNFYYPFAPTNTFLVSCVHPEH